MSLMGRIKKLSCSIDTAQGFAQLSYDYLSRIKAKVISRFSEIVETPCVTRNIFTYDSLINEIILNGFTVPLEVQLSALQEGQYTYFLQRTRSQTAIQRSSSPNIKLPKFNKV